MAAITNYSTLQAEIETNLHRSDISSATIQGFIDLAETRLREDLRVREMEVSADISIDSQEESLPTGFVGMRRFYLGTDPVTPLVFSSPDAFWRMFLSSQTSRPTHFTIEGNNFVFGPSPDATYTGKILYYALIALATTDPSALLTANPNLYLYASMIEAGVYLGNDKIAMKYGLLYREALVAKKRSDKHSRFSGQALIPRPHQGTR